MTKKATSDQVLAQQLAEQNSNTTNLAPAAMIDAGKSGTEDAANEEKPKSGRGRPAGSKNKEIDPNAPPKVTTPRVRVPAGSKPSVVLALHVPDVEERHRAMRLTRDDAIGEETSLVTAGIIDKLAKKVGEKAVNLLRHRGQPEKVQVYTQIGLDLLIAEGVLTSKALTERFAVKYKDGTCRAQGNQLMQLLPALQIVKPGSVKGTLVPNKRSLILADYQRNQPTAAKSKTEDAPKA